MAWRYGSIGGIGLPDPDLPVSERAFDGFGVESVHPCLARAIVDECFQKVAFLVVEERCLIGPIWNGEEAEQSNDHADEALDDEDPSPSQVAIRACHSRNSISEQATKSRGESGRTHEDAEPPLELKARIVCREEENSARDESCFEEAYEYPHGNQSAICLYHPLTDSENSQQ